MDSLSGTVPAVSIADAEQAGQEQVDDTLGEGHVEGLSGDQQPEVEGAEQGFDDEVGVGVGGKLAAGDGSLDELAVGRESVRPELAAAGREG